MDFLFTIVFLFVGFILLMLAEEGGPVPGLIGFVLLSLGIWNSVAYVVAEPNQDPKDFTVAQLVQEAEREDWKGIVLEKGEAPKYITKKGAAKTIEQLEKFDPKTPMIDERTEYADKYRDVTAGDLETVIDKGGQCSVFGVDKLDGRCYRTGDTATIEVR